jgi:hypothetical protein
MGRHSQPKWAWFLDGKDVDRLSHKQLQSACRKGRLGAAGSSDELRGRLRAFSASKEPPRWFVDGMQHGLSASAAANAARTLKLPVGEQREDGAPWHRKVSITVGQRLEHTSNENKCSGRRVALESAKPADCLTATHRQSQAGARSGFIGGPTKRTAIFEAKAPGTATVVLSSFSGAGRPWRRVGEVSVTVTS